MAQAKHTLIGLVLIDLTRVWRTSGGMGGFPVVSTVGVGGLLAVGCRMDRLGGGGFGGSRSGAEFQSGSWVGRAHSLSSFAT